MGSQSPQGNLSSFQVCLALAPKGLIREGPSPDGILVLVILTLEKTDTSDVEMLLDRLQLGTGKKMRRFNSHKTVVVRAWENPRSQGFELCS